MVVDILILKIHLVSVHMSVFPECVHVYRMHAWCLWSSEEGNGFPGAGVTDGATR